MNIDNVKQIFGSPVMGSDKPTNKKDLLPILIVVALSVVGIAIYLKHKQKQKRKQEERNVK